MENLMSLTKEMEKVISVNDLESLSMVLNMRQEAMDRVDKINKEIDKTVSSLEPPYRDKIKQLLHQTGQPVQLDNPLETNIFDTNKITLQLLKKIVDLDQAVNDRIHKGASGGTSG